jgi:hypothetical protein
MGLIIFGVIVWALLDWRIIGVVCVIIGLCQVL